MADGAQESIRDEGTLSTLDGLGHDMSRRHYGRDGFESSNEEKLFFPGSSIRKGQVIDYYERIAGALLPHLRDRPLVLQRFPDGIEEEGFYQKQVGSHFPDWIDTVRVELRSESAVQTLVVCNKKATLAYLADQGVLTLHPWLSRRDRLDHPDLFVIDLDPPGDRFESVRQAALHVRSLLRELDLPGFPKLTGSKGIHVVVPLDRTADFDTVREFARRTVALLEVRHPNELTTAQRKVDRGDRVYLDIARNAYGQTAVAPWSLRPLPGAPIAAPVAWADLERPGIGPRDYTLENVFRRIAQRADPWASLRRRRHALGRAEESLRKRIEAEGG